VEAMLSGTPVVATKNRGHRELIHDGENGYLVNVDDYKEMFSKVKILLENQYEHNRIRESALLFAVEYGFNNVKNELKQIYF
jgi:glycosyltransferase EpsD